MKNSKYFNAEYFEGQSPWYGPLLGEFSTILTTTADLPAGTYDVAVWIFDEQGQIIAEAIAKQNVNAGTGIDVDICALFPLLPPLRGMIATLIKPNGAAVGPDRLVEAWTCRFERDGAFVDMVVSTNPPTINFPELTGRSGTYRMMSTVLRLDSGWAALSSHSNVSANPEYRASISMQVMAYDPDGRSLVGPKVSVPPFGTYWLDLSEAFGDGLKDHLSRSNGRGSYMVTSGDGAAVGYHFLYNPDGRHLAADHTRPALWYLHNEYGGSPYNRSLGWRFFARAVAGSLKFRVSR